MLKVVVAIYGKNVVNETKTRSIFIRFYEAFIPFAVSSKVPTTLLLIVVN